MKIVNPSVKCLMASEAIKEMVLNCEYAARTCYNSIDRQTGKFEDAVAFLKSLIARHHESVLEHSLISFECITNIGVSREFMRHRLQSPSERSTRYCNFTNKEKYGRGLEFCLSASYKDNVPFAMEEAFEKIEDAYQHLVAEFKQPQIARAVLPLATKTVFVTSANIREWRHILKMRLSKAAHPDIIELSKLIYDEFIKLGLGPLFEDIVN